MLHVSRSLPDIAVLRGGSEEFATSLSEGSEVLSSLKRIGYAPLDVLIGKDGGWTANGIPTDAHQVFSRAHTVVDTTRMKSSPHHELAKRMGIAILFSRANQVCTDRENLYRLLRMQNIKVPETKVVRAKEPLKDSIFREVWSTYHTPLMLRPLARNQVAGSKLITQYPDFEESVRGYHEKGVDIHILTYRKAPVTSLVVLPRFRGERLYMPVWVETFASLKGIPQDTHQTKTFFNAPEYRKNEMRKIAEHIYDAAGLTSPAVIDIVHHGKEYIVVNIDDRPSLTKESRFMKSLESVGADIGQYIHAQVEYDYLNENSQYDFAR